MDNSDNAEAHFSVHKFDDHIENVSREELGDQLSEEDDQPV